jgi:hypothetical protein
MTLFNVTYEIVTPESAEEGEAEEIGFIAEGIGLREAAREVFRTRTSKVDCCTRIEPSASGLDFDWITVTNGMEYHTGANESRSLHIPSSVTNASRARIARLLGCRIY